MKKILFFLVTGLAVITCCNITQAQVPHGFNYQAVATTGSGSPIANTPLQVKIGILSDTVSNVYVFEELHSVTTNKSGLFSLVVGTGTWQQGSAATFDAINWSSTPLFIRTQIYYQSVWKYLGSAELWSVPYSLVSGKTDGVSSGAKLAIVSSDDTAQVPLFEVKRKDGQTVFAVYNDAVNVFVPDQTVKGKKGGFAIGGFNKAKAVSQDFFTVTADSIRMYINNNPVKGSTKGGFAIGGFGSGKGPGKKYLSLYGAGTIDTITNASQIMWYPNKEAFLAGRIEILHPDSVGMNSFSTGYKNMAIGNYSHALGYEAIARGDYSTAIGRRAIAGENSFALGNFSTALGNDSYAIGSASEASGNTSFALGVGSKATGLGSLSLGFQSLATYPYAVAIGYQSKALDTTAHSFGLKAEASGFGSLALGMYSKAQAQFSTSLGFHSTAVNPYSMAIGYYAIATGFDSYAIGSQAEANGDKSFAIGSYGLNENGTVNTNRATWTPGYYSLAFGMGAQATQLGAMALGVNATAAGDKSVSIGFGTNATGQFSTAMGYKSIANGDKSIAIGAYYHLIFNRLVWEYNPSLGNWIINLVPTEIDKDNIADGAFSIAIGNGNNARKGGLCLGTNNNANSFGSVAIGHSNVSDSSFTFTAGYNNRAIGIKAFALGENLTAISANSFVIGAYNAPTGSNTGWIPSDPLFVIGNGLPGQPSNAFTVLKDGNIILKPGLMIGSGTPLVLGGDGALMRQASSERYKDDINDLTDITWLYDFRPVSFIYKNDPNKAIQYGLVAEDVEKINKDFVFYLNGKPDAVNYFGLFAPVLKALQEQKNQIDNLNIQNYNLVKENNDLKLRMEKLESIVSSIVQEKK
jgi:hypothetical protein